ncbi:MAG: DinB family protein [Chitinophagaceae bacterium]
MISKKELIVPQFYTTYVNKVGDEDIITALNKNTQEFTALLQTVTPAQHNYAYAPGKWTIKEMLQHIIDAERVFTLRAVWFARKDASPQPGFDENLWAANAPVDHRLWEDLVKEFNALRTATTLLFASFNDQQLLQTGVANNSTLSVATLGYVCAGHVWHHMGVLRDRYGI